MAKQARQWITINVTEEDIREGVRGSCSACPVARAFKRAVPAACDVEVGACVCWGHDNSRWVALLPDSARDFIGHFDDGEPVKPFQFSLYLKNVQNGGAL